MTMMSDGLALSNLGTSEVVQLLILIEHYRSIPQPSLMFPSVELGAIPRPSYEILECFPFPAVAHYCLDFVFLRLLLWSSRFWHNCPFSPLGCRVLVFLQMLNVEDR